MDRYICIHAHFYQPPRENPWLEAVEGQESARPYHDWNERITAECYAPNTAARILDAQGRIRQIINNYSRISFNFGPTLLSWMAESERETCQRIIDSDRDSQKRFSGHGSALAQGYNHMILPLANQRDKETQIRWGIRDFVHRFGRTPEGMWLPETAVDVETLEVLARHGIRFTILAPHQAARVRRMGSRAWKDLSGGRIDPSRSYLARLPSGQKISLFFYDGPISQAVAFEKLLDNGHHFVERLRNGFSAKRTWPQLVHIATDGETYGHHHKYGEMALSYALEKIESEAVARLTNYGEFLEKFPPGHEVQIVENTSWSCMHGVGRWQEDCGCNFGREGWNQQWRRPLRTALNSLRDHTAALFEQQASAFLRDPWAARNDYIEVVLDRSPETVRGFLGKHSRRELKQDEIVTVLKLLEMQRHAMLMFTSCGWFFEEISGIETAQVLLYSGRVIQLAHEVSGVNLEPDFLRLLAEARSNIPEMGDGAQVYQRLVKPAFADLCKVSAHFAISSVFNGAQEHPRFCYEFSIQDSRRADSGPASLAVGQAHVTSKITRESRDIGYAVIHFGDHVLQAGVRDATTTGTHNLASAEAVEAFSRGDVPQTLRLLDQNFNGMQYSLRSLFHDEQKRILSIILGKTLSDAEAAYHAIYERHGTLLRFLREMDQPVPEVLRNTAEFVLNRDLRHTLESDPVDAVRVSMLMELTKREGAQPNAEGLSYAASNALNRIMQQLRQEPHKRALLENANVLSGLFRLFPFPVNFWQAQNIFYSLLNSVYPVFSGQSDAGSHAWVECFLSLGEKLMVAVPVHEPRLELANMEVSS
jgi:alpha-amylase/alpha-mannosidase (GH57 family)